jgi:hypothetical protein
MPHDWAAITEPDEVIEKALAHANVPALNGLARASNRRTSGSSMVTPEISWICNVGSPPSSALQVADIVHVRSTHARRS